MSIFTLSVKFHARATSLANILLERSCVSVKRKKKKKIKYTFFLGQISSERSRGCRRTEWSGKEEAKEGQETVGDIPALAEASQPPPFGRAISRHCS